MPHWIAGERRSVGRLVIPALAVASVLSTGAGAEVLWTGNWTGRGAGEEVRFHRPGVLTLTVRHATEFFFHVDENGNIEGEGTIEYELIQDTTGLDSLVKSVSSSLGMLWAGGAMSGTTGSIFGAVGGGGSVAAGSLQYRAPHLKHGKEVRRFTIRGHSGFTVDPARPPDQQDTRGKIHLEQVGEFSRLDGEVDNQLAAEWEVSGEKTESQFPCWSPFLEASGTMRLAAGDIWVAEFQETGEHRNDVRPWEGYSYVWMARRTE